MLRTITSRQILNTLKTTQRCMVQPQKNSTQTYDAAFQSSTPKGQPAAGNIAQEAATEIDKLSHENSQAHHSNAQAVKEMNKTEINNNKGKKKNESDEELRKQQEATFKAGRTDQEH